MTLTDAPTDPAPADAAHGHHLSAEQVRFFDTHGYLVLRGRVTGALLERLQHAAIAWIDDGRVMYRVDYLHDKGARSIYGNEKDYTLDVVRRCKAILEQQGYKVYLSRSGDYFVSLDDRSAFANQFSNAMFISVHFNSGQSLASGLEVFTLAPRGVPSMASDGPRMSDLVECKGNKRDAENMALATATHAAMVGRSRLFDRGIKRARFVVIRDIGIPGVLIEGGFLSNSHDAKLIASAQYRQLMAFSIAMAVNNYQRATTANPPPFLAKAPQVQLRDESGAEIQPPANGEGSEASPTPEASPEPTVEHAAPAVIPPPESTTEQPQPNDTPKPEA